MSSGRFRTNAQKKRMDVWLIYRCAVCDETWNMPVVERRPIARMSPDQLQSFMRNDPAAAARHAFDHALLTRHNDRIDQDMAATIEKHIEDGNIADATCLEIVIALSLPCRLRLDALLAREVGISRSAFLRAYEAGVFALTQASRKTMRGPVFGGQRIRVDLSKAKSWSIEVDRIWNPAT